MTQVEAARLFLLVLNVASSILNVGGLVLVAVIVIRQLLKERRR